MYGFHCILCRETADRGKSRRAKSVFVEGRGAWREMFIQVADRIEGGPELAQGCM
jgi:hypothetical protein